MSQPPRKRGRPRTFDPDQALDGAFKTFLFHGYSAASLEALTRAMRLSKPSLYAAFGDKRALYLRVLSLAVATRGARYRAAFERERDLERALSSLLEEAVEINLPQGASPGCLVASAATTEAVTDEAIRDFAREFFATSDRVLARMIERKDPACDAKDAERIARLANAVIHDISLRARVGEPRAKLRSFARDSAKMLAGFAVRGSERGT